MDPQDRVKAKLKRQEREALRYKKAGRWIGLTFGAMVLSIYGYSMYMVKQETIIKEIDDDLDSSSS